MPQCCGLVALALLAACSPRVPLTEPGASDSSPADALASLSIPLDLRQFDVAVADRGQRGVFLKLSRLPDEVTHRSETRPARIILDIKGPTGAETPEEAFPAGDTLVSRMRVSRQAGVLRVVLDLQGDKPPEYSVHVMADWIMIRLAPDTSSGLRRLSSSG